MDLLEKLVPLLETVLTHPAVVSAIVAMGAGLIGRARLERIPFFGILIGLLAEIIDRVRAEMETARIEAASEAAKILVEGQEQLKAVGKVDGPTAAVNVSAELIAHYRVDKDLARVITEAAVYRLNDRQKWDTHIGSEVSDDDLLGLSE